jgi:acylphosphatase
MKHLIIIISGHVQGVTFRYSAKVEADKLGLTGCAQNLPNESVQIDVEGSEAKIEQFLSWCHEGPNLARVEDVHVQTASLKGYKEFNII